MSLRSYSSEICFNILTLFLLSRFCCVYRGHISCSTAGTGDGSLDVTGLLLPPVSHSSADLQGELDHPVDGLLNVIQTRNHYLWTEESGSWYWRHIPPLPVSHQPLPHWAGKPQLAQWQAALGRGLLEEDRLWIFSILRFAHSIISCRLNRSSTVLVILSL